MIILGTPQKTNMTLLLQCLPFVLKIMPKVLTYLQGLGGLTPPHPSHFSWSLLLSYWLSLKSLEVPFFLPLGGLCP